MIVSDGMILVTESKLAALMLTIDFSYNFNRHRDSLYDSYDFNVYHPNHDPGVVAICVHCDGSKYAHSLLDCRDKPDRAHQRAADCCLSLLNNGEQHSSHSYHNAVPIALPLQHHCNCAN